MIGGLLDLIVEGVLGDGRMTGSQITRNLISEPHTHAKGCAGARSDFDLLVVAALDGNPGIHQRRARQLAADCFPPVDVVFATPFEIDAADEAKSPFLASILGSGITVYERAG